MRKHIKLTSAVGAVVAALAILGLTVITSSQGFNFGKRGSGEWPLMGQNIDGTRNQPAEHFINPSNVSTLAPAWTFTTGGSVSDTPTVAGDTVYFPDWAGNLYAVNKNTGQLIWSHKISDYDGFSTAISRTSPAVDGDELIIGDIENPNADHQGTNIIAVDRQTGNLRWITKVESYPAAIITGSPVVFGNTVYVGVSSNEESTLANEPTYTSCCAFRGSVVALDANTGGILWQTYDMPDNSGDLDEYSGGAIWQPPAIDPRRGLLYIGTGNNYTVPADVEACQQQAVASGNTGTDCTAADDYFDTALALDIHTGHVRWAHKLYNATAGMVDWFYKTEPYDAWTTGCRVIPVPINCPPLPGPDYDLGGSGPNLLHPMVGFGSKSGIYWALDPDDGHVLWKTFVGPAGTGTLGGIEWGTATDGQRIYAEVADSGHVPYTLIPSGQQITWGSWSALDARTGKILWQTADPTPGIDFGAVSVANGVVYAGSQSRTGYMYALDAATGKILWSFKSGGSVDDGPSIVGRFVYWGSGYKIGTNNNKVYAFTVPAGAQNRRQGH
ncbi:MAG: PQQ-binding-like beta-propeller repeat protein [Terriglobia bacterium]